MAHVEVGGILDTLFEMDWEVAPQICSHNLRKSSPLGSHKALLLPEVPVMPWRVEFPSSEQPVYGLQSVE